MITRLKINGFKNLNGVDIRFGPFTCIAGVNAVGKSNLFDAIRFLNNLATKSLIEAARSVRSEGQKQSDLREIFYKTGEFYTDSISFEVDMILPSEAFDELGQKAKASITSVRYCLELKFRDDEDPYLTIEREELFPITQTEATQELLFEHRPKWRKSVISGRRQTNTPFISTAEKNISGEQDQEDCIKIVRLHQDQTKGSPTDKIINQLPRTVLSTVNAEYPTACVARHEMTSWMLLQLEPSALRRSDDFEKRKNATLLADGSQIPAMLYRLQNENQDRDIYQELANRLSELVPEIRDVKIDKDEKRELLTLMVRYHDGSYFPARSLSDGTLRFLSLTALELDTKSGGVICLEEPENGIHPEKIGAMLRLLQDIATDPADQIGIDNPFRQVIINTHSPLVVQQTPEDSLVVAEYLEKIDVKTKKITKAVHFSPLPGTWRADEKKFDQRTVAIGKLLAFLGASPSNENNNYNFMSKDASKYRKNIPKRVIDREDIGRQLSLF